MRNEWTISVSHCESTLSLLFNMQLHWEVSNKSSVPWLAMKTSWQNCSGSLSAKISLCQPEEYKGVILRLTHRQAAKAYWFQITHFWLVLKLFYCLFLDEIIWLQLFDSVFTFPELSLLQWKIESLHGRSRALKHAKGRGTPTLLFSLWLHSVPLALSAVYREPRSAGKHQTTSQQPRVPAFQWGILP